MCVRGRHTHTHEQKRQSETVRGEENNVYGATAALYPAQT